jgi:hypothetical protein
MLAVGLVEEVLAIVNVPVAEPAVVGSNCTYNVVDCPGFSVAGKTPPERVKPVPATTAELTVTGSDPVDVRVTDCVAGVFKFTFPNVTVVALMLSCAVTKFNWRAKVFETPPAVAVNVAVWVEDTAPTVAVNPEVVAPAGTVTEDGTVTALLLLARFTAKPPLAAAAFSVTMQLSVPAPVIEPLAQLRLLRSGTPVPVPLRLIAADVPLDELLLSVSWPVAAPTTVGLNCTANVAVWPGLSVSGNVTPETVKPEPVTATPLIITAAVPVDDRVSVWVAGVFTVTLPNIKLVALIASVGTDVFNCKLKVCELPVVLAVSITVWELVTGEAAVAVNAALVALAGTIIDAGSITALELLAKATARPPAGAVAFRVTEQMSVPLSVIALAAQLNFFTCGTAFADSLIFLFEFVVAFELSVSCPVAIPDDFGSNWTVMIAVWLGFNVNG